MPRVVGRQEAEEQLGRRLVVSPGWARAPRREEVGVGRCEDGVADAAVEPLARLDDERDVGEGQELIGVAA